MDEDPGWGDVLGGGLAVSRETAWRGESVYVLTLGQKTVVYIQ